MIDVRIVCTHDAVKLAEMLTRLLEAEDHRVRLTYGRQALNELEDARGARDAVLLIWSPDARTQTYMLEWQRNIEPSRLIEIARGASDFPNIKRLAAVIDFSQWRGQRGARAWKALNERLAVISRALTPQKPAPPQAIWAMGVATAAAVTGAVFVRVNTAMDAVVDPAPLQAIAANDPSSGLGGPLSAIEPASLEDNLLRVRDYPDIEPIDMGPSEPLAPLVEHQAFELRDRTLLERIDAAISPLIPGGNEPQQN
jgi:hypothetical protein